MANAVKSARSAPATTPKKRAADAFSAAERAAMKERVKEMTTARGKGRDAEVEAEAEVLAKIAEMPPHDRALGERIHSLVRAAAPALTPRTYYGMPAYAKDGKVICFFKPADKFKARYATFEFNDAARLDDGRMWPIGYAVTELTAAEEKRITELVTRAAG